MGQRVRLIDKQRQNNLAEFESTDSVQMYRISTTHTSKQP